MASDRTLFLLRGARPRVETPSAGRYDTGRDVTMITGDDGVESPVALSPFMPAPTTHTTDPGSVADDS